MSLDVYCGPMKSGKSQTLLNRMNTLSDVNQCAGLIINHCLDIRNVKMGMSSHSSLFNGIGRLNFTSSSRLATIDVTNYTSIGIDEVQFFELEDLVLTVKLWISLGKHIICSGLDGDSNMNTFGHIAALLPISDSFIKLNAICDVCKMHLSIAGEKITPLNQTPAPFTKKIIQNDDLIDIGGSDKYLSVCRKHHP